jgi:DNA-binding protein H-NS
MVEWGGALGHAEFCTSFDLTCISDRLDYVSDGRFLLFPFFVPLTESEPEVFIVEYANLSVEEIKQQLAEIKSSEAELKRALEVRRQEAKYEIAQQIRDLIAQYGYTLDEILPLVEGKRRRATAPAAARRPASGTRQYTRYVDPQNSENVYVRGVLPGWMKQKMQEKGYDPSSKTDRESFKSNYLQAVQG